MPPKKKKSEPQTQVSPERIKQVWTALSVDSWLDFFNHFREGHQFRVKGKELWGCCPYHSDPHASFHIRFQQGYAKCFGECSKFESDPIALAAKASGKPYHEAFSYLLTTYGLPGFAPSALQHIQAIERKNEVKRYILQILNAELVDAASIGRTDPKFAYAQPLIQWLDQRKVPLNFLHTLPLGVIPPPDRLWDRLQELERQTKNRYHTEIQNYLEEIIPLTPTQSGSYCGWLLFANHISPNVIGLFRIRQPGSKEIRVIQEDGNEQADMGLFGLGTGIYQTVIGNTEQDVASRITVVEGEFTALAAMIPQIMTGNLETIVVAASGNNNHRLDGVEQLGFKEVRLIGDRDDGGTSFVKSHLKETHTRCRVFDWPPVISVGSDIHDAYMALDGATVTREVANDQNYRFPQDWALQRLDIERQVYKQDDVGSLAKLAIRIGKVLTDPTEQEVYVAAAAQLLGIPDSQLKKYVASPDTETGFVAMMANQLEKVYKFLYQEQTGSGAKMVAWNRLHRKVTTFDLAKKSQVLGVLESDIGAIVDWVANHVGEPEWLKSAPDQTGNVIEKRLIVRQKEYESFLVNQVIPRLASGLPLKTTMTPLGQGVHWKDEKYYVVNGDLFCKGEVRDDGSIYWSDVDGLVDSNFYVEQTDARYRWSKAFASANDINSYAPVNLTDWYRVAREVFDTGWAFENHELEVSYLAGLIFSVAMADVFDALPWMFVNAPYQSGKSYLILHALSSTKKGKSIQVLEASYGADAFSEAGVRQRMRDSTLMLLLDEFEVGHENERRPRRIHVMARSILDALRGANTGGTNVTLGSTSGNFVNYRLRFAFAGAGITPLIDKADISRFNMINLRFIGSGGIKGSTPEYQITTKFSQETLQQLRFATTMFALQNIERVRQTYDQVRSEFADGQYFDPEAESRFKQSLIPILAVMKMAGQNYKEFAKAYSAAKVSRMRENYSSMTEYDELWHTLLHSPGIRIPGEEYKDRTFTLAEILADPRKRHLINDTNTGLYYVSQKKYLVVAWTTASASILRSTTFGARNALVLRQTSLLDKRLVSPTNLRRDGAVMSVLAQYGCKVNDVSVIPVQHFVDDIGEIAGNNSSHTPPVLAKNRIVIDDDDPASGKGNI